MWAPTRLSQSRDPERRKVYTYNKHRRAAGKAVALLATAAWTLSFLLTRSYHINWKKDTQR